MLFLSDSDLKERLGRILQSDYFTTPPELQTLNATAEISGDGGEAQLTSDSTAETQQVRLMQNSHARNWPRSPVLECIDWGWQCLWM
jgi:hypothetical protein